MTLDVPDAGDVATQLLERPSAPRLVWYSLGGSLSERHNSWVLHDVTCPTWTLRHFARALLVIIPLFVLYMAFIPGGLAIRLYTGLTFSAALLLISIILMLIDTDRRAVRAGFRFGLVSNIRTARSVERQRLASYHRRERIAARRARR
jgi:hypothetical protein